MYFPVKKPRKTWVFTLCTHPPPNLMLWLPWMIENLSLKSVRQKSSSTAGSRKKGWPNRNVVAKPMAVSGTWEGTALRGRFSREELKRNSFNLVGGTVVNQL